MTPKAENIVHLHVHGEESLLDGLSTAEELVAAAREIGSPALGITDHGVCGAIPDFIKACEKAGIKPIPGVEAYTTKDRLVQSEELEMKRKSLCIKYKITDNKGKPKMKVLQDFLKVARKKPEQFEQAAKDLLKNYLMDSPADLLSDDIGMTVEMQIEEFRSEINEYLDHDNFHLLLIAVNNQGLEDLYEIISDSHLNGFYSDPRTDLRYIRDNNLGRNLIATSSCLGSYLARLCFTGRMEEAKRFIQECKETFLEFYLELQATDVEEQAIYNDMLDMLAIETNTPKVVTTDVHFARKEDHKIHDVLVAASFNKCVLDEDRYHYSKDHYIKSVDEIRETFHDEEAIQNTLRIAEKVNVTLPKEPLFPKFPVTEGDTVEEILKKKSWDALFQYALKNPSIDFNEYANRLNYELSVIIGEGFTDYFLITEDFITATKRAGFLVGPGRGSGAGSLVCFMLNITTLDPIKNKLLFERFLNPERVGYPDLDLDFSYAGSQWVFNYLQEKYGYDKVAQIGTKGTLAARAVCRLVGKTLGYDLKIQDAFAKAIPSKPGMKLKKAYEEEEMVRRYAENYPEWWEAMTKLEGHKRSVGVHAAGTVISPEKLTKSVPLRADSNGTPTTQYDMEWIEKFLVKFDLLKLDTLDLIKKTMEYAGIWGKVDIDAIDLNDQKAYQEVYNALNLSGIFQVEGDGMKDVISHLKPNCFEDIGVVVALFRPGPMDLIPTYINRKFGREKTVYAFDSLEPVLRDTYGIFVYQEQVMEASQILGGLTLGQADMIRKGVAKKKVDLMNRWIDLMIYGSQEYSRQHEQLIQQYPDKSLVPEGLWVDYDYQKEVPYVEGALARGYELNKLLELKAQWIKFGEYCFNRAHSAAYAMISVQTAWLKAYYPTEFMAALMSISEGKKDKNGNGKNIIYMRESEVMGIEILPPDINESDSSWTPVVKVDRRTIRYGLASIAGISGASVEAIILGKPYASVQDLIEKTDSRAVNKTKIVNLIKSGAFDQINDNRNKLIRDYIQFRNEDYEFLPSRTTKADVIKFEREVLGTSVTIKSRWETIEEGKKSIQFTGMIMDIKPFVSKKGQEHARLVLETAEDTIQCLIFNRSWMPLRDQLFIGQKVVIKGDKSDDSLLINNVQTA